MSAGRLLRSAGFVLLCLLGRAEGAARELRLAFIGDTGTGKDEQLAVRDQIQRLAPSHVFLLGDNIYDRGSRLLIGPRYDDVYTPLMRQGIVFHAALGNHDVEWCEASLGSPLAQGAEAYRSGAGLRCEVSYQLHHPPFGYPSGHRYYSVPIPAVNPLLEVFVLDSNTLRGSQSKLTLREDTAQLEWLDAALGRSRATWKVVAMHHPPHSPTTGAKYFFFVPLGGGRAREIRLEAQIAPMLKKHRVDAVFTGHNHFYARMLPQEGIRYFVSGGGGRKVYPYVESPGYVAAGGAFYHLLYLRITDEAVQYFAVDEEGRSRDAGWWGKTDIVDHAFPAGTLPPPK